MRWRFSDLGVFFFQDGGRLRGGERLKEKRLPLWLEETRRKKMRTEIRELGEEERDGDRKRKETVKGW